MDALTHETLEAIANLDEMHEPETEQRESAVALATPDAESAILLISEVAQFMHKLEAQSADEVERADDARRAGDEKLALVMARIEQAETGLKNSEAEIEQMTAALLFAQDDIKSLRAAVEARGEDIASMEQRAAAAEKRAQEAEASLQMIVTAVRTGLPRAIGDGGS